MKLRRLIAYLLAFALVFSCNSTLAFAAETEQAGNTKVLEAEAEQTGNTTVPEAGSFTYVNPLYEDLQIPDTTDDEGNEAKLQDASTPYFDSLEQACDYIRQCMVNRNATIKFDMFTCSEADWKSDLMNRVTEHTGNPEEGDYIRCSLQRYTTNYFYTAIDEDEIDYTVHVTMDVNYLTNKAQEDELSRQIDELENQLKLSSMSDYQKIRSIYGYITNNIDYDYAGLNDNSDIIKYSAYGALVEKSAVCQGYSLLMYRMLLDQNIDTRIITSDSLNHAWNIAKLGSMYYYMDSTWDAGPGTQPGREDYFLKGTSDFPGHANTDSQCNTELFKILFPLANAAYNESNPESSTKLDDVKKYGQCGADLVWLLKNDGTLVIDGKGDMWNVSTDRETSPLKDIMNEIVRIEFKEGVTSVGERYFKEAHNLKNISFAESIESIGAYAFLECEKLENVSLPAHLHSLGKECFAQCDSITEFVIPGQVTYIGPFCLKDINLKKITFEWDEGYEYNIFAYSARGIFAGTISLEEIVVDTAHPRLLSENGVLFDKYDNESASGTMNHKPLIAYPCNKADQEYSVPEWCSGISERAFMDCNNLKLVTFEGKMTEIGDRAFGQLFADPREDYSLTFRASKDNSVVIDHAKANKILFVASDACDNHSFDEGLSLKKIGNLTGKLYTCENCSTQQIVYTSPSYVKSFKLTKGTKSFTAKWTKQSKANQKKFTGYQIKYSVNADMSDAKTVNVAKSAASKTIKKLAKKKKYYVEIRSYVKKNGETFYSKATKKTVVTK